MEYSWITFNPVILSNYLGQPSTCYTWGHFISSIPYKRQGGLAFSVLSQISGGLNHQKIR